MNEAKQEDIKILCPLKREFLPICCNECKLAVKQENEIIGCAIKWVARRLMDNKNLSVKIKDDFIKFKKGMGNGGR